MCDKSWVILLILAMGGVRFIETWFYFALMKFRNSMKVQSLSKAFSYILSKHWTVKKNDLCLAHVFTKGNTEFSRIIWYPFTIVLCFFQFFFQFFFFNLFVLHQHILVGLKFHEDYSFCENVWSAVSLSFGFRPLLVQKVYKKYLY